MGEDRQETERVFRELRSKPLEVLAACPVRIGGLDGLDSTELELAFAYYGGEIRIGDTEYAQNFGNHGTQEDAVIQVRSIASPMRFDSVSTRLDPTARVDARHARLWATEQQTGCTVLILEWSDGTYSMVHLRPDADTDFHWITQLLISGDTGVRAYAKAAYKNFWLKQESTTIIGKSGSDTVTPNRYIMVQSTFATMRTYLTQLLGVHTASGWEFFKQSYQHDGFRGIYHHLTTQQLVWYDWSAWVPYWTQ